MGLDKVVMVVDDDEALRESVCEALQDDGYTTLCMDGASHALEQLGSDQRRPDLILLDLNMPGMTGWDFRNAQLGDEALAPIPTVVMTASRDTKNIDANEVVFKPLTREHLLDVVHRHTERPSPPGNGPPQRRKTDALGSEVAPKRALDEAVAERERLYSMFMQAPVPIYVLRGRDFVFEMANPLYEAMAGQTNLVGKTILEVIPDGYGERFARLLRNVLATDAPFFGNEELVRVDQVDRFFTFTAAPIHNLEGIADRVMVVVHEVTEHVLARRRVEESESRFRELVAQVKDYAIFRVDPQGRPVTWNEGVKRVLGFDEPEFIGHDLSAIFVPEDVEAHVPENELETAAREGTANDDRWMRRKNGERFAAAGVTTALRDPKGQLLGYTKVLRDQTEKVLAQEAAADLAAIVTSSDDAIISLDLHGLVRTWNRGAEQLFGYRPDEVIGRPLTMLIPEDRRSEEPRIRDRMTGETVAHYETVRRRKDGTLLDVALTVSPVQDASGRVIGVAKIARDITFRKRLDAAMRRSEARFRAIFEGTAVSIWEEDYGDLERFAGTLKAEHGPRLREFLLKNPRVVDEAIALIHVTDVNPATLRLLEASSKQELAAGLSRLVLPETRAAIVEGIAKLADGVHSFSTEAVLQTLKGRRVDVLLTMSFAPSDETAQRALITLTDISAQKLAEALREARVAEMERAVRFSEMFIGILGHDLRNPLNAISIASSLMSKTAPHVEKTASRIRSSAGRMERMISQLLDFTRVRLGRGIPLERTNVDLAEVCRFAIAEVETATGCEVKLEQEGDLRGNWDRDRLFQLVSNLVANACQHGKKGSVVTVRLNGSAPDRMQLEVRNLGAVPAELMPVLFEPLRSKDGGHKTRKGSAGLGLGLYITQQIVLAHGGEIRVESDEAQGTRFIVTLPRLPPAEADRVFGAPAS